MRVPTISDNAQTLDPASFIGQWPLVCPDCRATLSYETGTYRCLICSKNYAVEDGVVRFVEQDAFYENRYPYQPVGLLVSERSIRGLAALYLASMHYLWYIRRYAPRKSRILDVACGAGMRYLPTWGRVAGLELSFASARQMAKLYNLSLQANALKVPLAEGAVDVVVSRFFLEHVTREGKLPLLQELWRVLKPGGVLITLQDCECHNSLWRWAKQDPVLFQKHFIENDGHYGLVYASENLALFRQVGFEIVTYRASNKTPLVHLAMLQWMMAYRGKSRWLDRALTLASVVSQSWLLNQTYTTAVTLMDDLVETFLPLDHARYLLAVCRKGTS
jgi:SAM-dependent methyltransferase